MGCNSSKDDTVQEGSQQPREKPRDPEQEPQEQTNQPQEKEKPKEPAEQPKEEIQKQTVESTKEEPQKSVEPSVGVTEKSKEEEPPSQSAEGEFTVFQLDCLGRHNEYRERHGVPGLALNKEICDMAQEYAEELAKKKAMVHCDVEKRKTKAGEVCGENLAMTYSSNPNKESKGEEFVGMWYDEIKDYSYDNPGFAMNTGHFTQVVWKETKELGMGIAYYTNDEGWHTKIVVGRYLPSGNMNAAKYFEENVLQLVS